MSRDRRTFGIYGIPCSRQDEECDGQCYINGPADSQLVDECANRILDRGDTQEHSSDLAKSRVCTHPREVESREFWITVPCNSNYEK